MEAYRADREGQGMETFVTVIKVLMCMCIIQALLDANGPDDPDGGAT